MNTQDRVRYARKLRYAARDDGEGSCATYIAFLELAHRRDGPPIGYALYRRIMPYKGYDPSLQKTTMIELAPIASREEMVARYWLFPPKGQERNDFPGYRSLLWRETTTWLDRVAAGGWYESGGWGDEERPGQWMRVGSPASWKPRHKKKPLRFGFAAHIVLKLRAEMALLTEHVNRLRDLQQELLSWDPEIDAEYVHGGDQQAFDELERQVNDLIEERSTIAKRVDDFVEGMRREVRAKFPEPLGKTPKRVLRRERR